MLTRLMEHIGSDEVLLFSTDYPHAQFAETDVFPAAFAASLRDKIGGANPLATYPRLGPAP